MEDDGRQRILVCEDDGLLRATLDRGLRRAGYVVDCASTGRAAVELARTSPPDAVVMDIGLPDSDGRDVCQALRAQGCTAGVVFLSARDHTDDVLSGFAAGGDDYVSKPFELAELMARVLGLLRRRPPAAVDVSRLRVDPAAHTMRYADGETALTPTEFRLLARLISRRPEVVRRAELVAAAWPGSLQVSENTLDQYIARARRKLREVGFPAGIDNVRGVGYRLH
jgi:DNA-binding response OmpR family regulator